MDLEKALKFTIDYLSDYLLVSVKTLSQPGIRFSPINLPAEEGDHAYTIPKLDADLSGPRLNPKLLSFVVISIFVGVTLNTLIPNRKPAPDFIATAIFILISWFIYSTFIHLLCKVLKGTGSYEETLSVSLQLFSVLYVVSSFITLILGIVLEVPEIRAYALAWGNLSAWTSENPVYLFFIVQLVLEVIYLPLALRRVHRFRWSRQWALYILMGLVWVLCIVGAAILRALFSALVYKIQNLLGTG